MNNTQEGLANDVNGIKKEIGSKFAQVKEQVKETAGEAGQQVYDSAKTAVNEMRTEGKVLADQICSQTTKSVDKVRSYVKDYPIRSLAAAIGAGVLVGYLRRRS